MFFSIKIIPLFSLAMPISSLIITESEFFAFGLNRVCVYVHACTWEINLKADAGGKIRLNKGSAQNLLWRLFMGY